MKHNKFKDWNFWLVITFCNVSLVIIGPDCPPHRESWDFKLFIAVYWEYFELRTILHRDLCLDFVYWPRSGSPTKDLVWATCSRNLIFIVCFNNFVVPFWHSRESVWVSILKGCFILQGRFEGMAHTTLPISHLSACMCIRFVNQVVGLGEVEVRQRSGTGMAQW